MATLLLPQPLADLSSSSAPRCPPRRSPSHRLLPLAGVAVARRSRRGPRSSRPLTVRRFALTESDPPQSLESGSSGPLLPLELAESFDLPSDYFAQLPRDLRLDLNDAAFDLSNGPVVDECGEELGELLLNWSKSWEQADTSTSRALASKLPLLESSLTDSAKSALGKRLLSAGRRFQSMGQYGQGELDKIAKIMITTGKRLAAIQESAATVEKPEKEARTFKFGELQVQVTSDKANIGAAIGFAFGILSWQLAQGVQSIPESSLQYANDNALLLAKSLRGALLVMGYSSAILSASAAFGLLVLARQLKSEDK
ncbi:hypothetical protein BT93_H2947 [Corymbia citriodora subsp. variegata]|nr:hypothetical protein BT93_H2947 [Corymbia citriodora subsp. variegata]